MTRFVVVDPTQGEQADIDFAHFVEIAKGATIRSAAAGDDYLEFGLAEQINIRVQTSEVDGVVVTLMSTLNKGDIPPIRLQIIEADEIASAALVESRIHALRQSYAIAYLLRMMKRRRLSKRLPATQMSISRQHLFRSRSDYS